MQDGFLRVWHSKYRRGPDVVPILFTAVKRSAIDAGRRRTRREERERRAGADAEVESAPWFEPGAASDERGCLLEKLMKALPDTQREVLTLKIWADMTFAQIGESVGISPNTAASRYRYGLEALQKALRHGADTP